MGNWRQGNVIEKSGEAGIAFRKGTEDKIIVDGLCGREEGERYQNPISKFLLVITE